MSEMIERVARAICVSDGLDPDRKFKSSDISDGKAPHELAWHEYQPAARAAVEAMRVPTEAQLEAAEEIVVGYDDFACGDGNIYLGIPGYPQKASDVWSALIDAALKENV